MDNSNKAKQPGQDNSSEDVTALVVAKLRDRGFAVCKPNQRQKKPTYRKWATRSLEPIAFKPGDQLGIIGGPLSDGNQPGHALVIVDLDSANAVAKADDYLPATGMVD
ncbi:MAG TPA: hypothetical protein VGF55_31000, partial [Gemmataceae bacterium]